MFNIGLVFRIKDLQTFEFIVKLKSNFYVGPVDIFPNFWHCHDIGYLG